MKKFKTKEERLRYLFRITFFDKVYLAFYTLKYKVPYFIKRRWEKIKKLKDRKIEMKEITIINLKHFSIIYSQDEKVIFGVEVFKYFNIYGLQIGLFFNKLSVAILV